MRLTLLLLLYWSLSGGDAYTITDTIEMLDTQGVYMLSLSTNKIYMQAVNYSSFFLSVL